MLPHIGSCADDIALVRSVHTDAFNHHPAQILMNTGVGFFGRPTIGSWLNYGLGSENESLPAFVVMKDSAAMVINGVRAWGSGFMPSSYQGVLFETDGELVRVIEE